MPEHPPGPYTPDYESSPVSTYIRDAEGLWIGEADTPETGRLFAASWKLRRLLAQAVEGIRDQEWETKARRVLAETEEEA